jgi:hypothetical protein
MKYIGLIMIIAGMLTTLGGFGRGAVFQMIAGAVATFVGSQIYTRQRDALPASQQSTTSKSKFELSDEMIIRLANRIGNKLSVDDLVQQTSLTRDQAKTRLEQLHQKGVCQIDLNKVEESGKIYYYF